ncbi:MAG: matrixin family metalloprotease [bacterium]|nr:matrixin family metalloprotease [bacterium]
MKRYWIDILSVNKKVRFIFKILLIVLICGTVYFQLDDVQRGKVEKVFFDIQNKVLSIINGPPCSKPISYTLGSFDKDFGVSQEEFLVALTDAEKIWEGPSGKDLFVYDKENGDLKINLIYDYRQKTTTTLSIIDKNVQNVQSEYNTLKAKYEQSKGNYNTLQTNFINRVQAFNQKQKTYNEQVAYWNSRGGAPKEEFEKLENIKIFLKNEVVVLQSIQKDLNNMVVDLNNIVAQINSIAKNLNISADAYNKIGEVLGDGFEEGVYTTDGINQKIDIFEFKNREKLVRILAHELGHALGIGHVADSGAIMYAYNQNITGALTEDDINALNVVCTK